MSSHLTDAVVPAGVTGVDPAHPLGQPMRILDAERGIIERARPKVAFVGYASSSRDAAPYDDPDYDIVGLNQLYRFIPRANAWCDIHANWEEDNVEGTDHRGWLAKCGIPILMAEPDPGLPTAVRYPLQAVIETVGVDYFTSTVAFLIGWGIHPGYEEIGIYGIDLVVGTEYDVQKACAEYMLGVAHGRGIIVRMPANCALLRHSHRYGYERAPSWGPVSLDEFGHRVDALVKQRDLQL